VGFKAFEISVHVAFEATVEFRAQPAPRGAFSALPQAKQRPDANFEPLSDCLTPEKSVLLRLRWLDVRWASFDPFSFSGVRFLEHDGLGVAAPGSSLLGRDANS
jgi:hypothetical protein